MGMGWHEWPLMIFTVLGQCVVGGFIVLALALISGRLDNDRTRRVHLSMFFLWVLMGIAFIASVMHLGSPMRAFNSLNRIGESALSNEIASGSVFFAVGGIYWLLAVLNKMPAALGKLWLAVTMVLGLFFVYAMCRVYQIDTVPTWHNGYTTLGFVLTMFIGGPLLGFLLLRAAGVCGCAMRILPVISGLAVLISVASVAMQGFGLAEIHSSVQQASALIPSFGALLAWRLALLVLGLGCWICPMIKGRAPSVAWLVIAFLLVVAGELIGRGMFYGLHMTVGMAIAG
ncbi:dimethyl sulfoxide reductase anchor subunit family protein [Hafnia alvei]|uniref:Anaerobic dimethyl sulfoxide reductase subunit C (DMSO reductase anchor subunit) n=1 Tax=Hafnia alvei TaxID=569 RepID=A0A1C6Z2D5_HAFAL|nr:dimethyl sulfoxide reductase anchor subunit family protein [Hafnia alvei]NLS56447.1 dimethylsulfoxide reductase [Hafnia alvei]SCM53245.1 anaerobic dimethyl sulfoxide reductase subunit C (DMSO reductase anchor subunit) [Hafnia alvei]